MILLSNFIQISNEWLIDKSEGNLFRRIGTEGFTLYCALLYIKDNKDKFQTTIKEIQNILCRNYNKRPKIIYSTNKSNYINVNKDTRTLKKYFKILCQENLIKIEDNIEKIDEARITDYIIIKMTELEYKKGYTYISCNLILDKIHKIGHIGFSLLYLLTNLFNEFANPSEEYLASIIKRDVNTVRVYLYLLQENKLIKILPQSPVLLDKDKHGNNIYQYMPNHYIVNNKLPGNEYYKNKNEQNVNEENEEILTEEKLEQINILKTMPYKEYLQTEHWKNIRKKVLAKARYKCQLCNNKNNLHVHHNTYENRGNERLEDLIVLCEDCHTKFHIK